MYFGTFVRAKWQGGRWSSLVSKLRDESANLHSRWHDVIQSTYLWHALKLLTHTHSVFIILQPAIALCLHLTVCCTIRRWVPSYSICNHSFGWVCSCRSPKMSFGLVVQQKKKGRCELSGTVWNFWTSYGYVFLLLVRRLLFWYYYAVFAIIC